MQWASSTATSAAEVRQQLQAAGREQALRRDVQQIERGIANRVFGLGSLVGRQSRIQRRRAHPRLAKRVHLVLHQRDQWRHDDRETRAQQRRDLITKRLAAAGRHQHQSIAAAGHVFDDLELLAAEAVEAENLAQHSVWGAPSLVTHRKSATPCSQRDVKPTGN
jgi:hypothetical protein